MEALKASLSQVRKPVRSTTEASSDAGDKSKKARKSSAGD
jgi:hypothetical protein